MNIFTATNRSSAEPARATAPRNARVRDLAGNDVRSTDVRASDDTGSDSRVDDREEGSDRRIRSKSPEFAALLALLAGAGQQVRNEFLQQLPDESASLVDRLLEEAAGNTPSQDIASPVAMQVAEPGTAANASDAASAMASGGAGAASDAMRYGMLQKQSDADPTSDVVDLPAYARAREARGNEAREGVQGSLDGLARAASRLQGMDNDKALEVLSRVASSRGSSLEQLLALGDTRGANTRAQLDALIAKAGTPEGARLAARALMNEAGAALDPVTDARTNAALPAAASSRAAALRNGILRADTAAEVTSLDVATADRSLEGLSPELRARVERVMERMKNEYGHDVTLVETTRSQERQDWLFAQGRTRSGPVVTWTRDSAHTRGEAVDVMIDGSWDNAAGFARLQRIAREEGLRTLGMKDPGHLELPSASSPVDRAAEARAKVDARIPQDTANGRGVASVARVAGVAGVARVADQGAAAATGAEAFASGTATLQAASSNGHQGHGHAFGRGERDESGKPLNNGKALGKDAQLGEGRGNDQAAFGAFGGPSGTPGHTGVTGADRAAQVGGSPASTQAERVSDIQQMRADAPATPLNRMTLNVESAPGIEERITIDVRGNTVQTQITTDASTADRMRLRTADLQDALGRHGLESDRLRIRSNGSTDSVELSRAVSGEREAQRVGHTGQSSTPDQQSGNSARERTPAREYQDEARRDSSSRARDDRQEQQQQRQGAPRPAFTLFGNE
ncbi:M15 family metallopeptidase [Gemmatimonas sp. UBA7669]|uniref:M15 family metallopeptidase n=1 Tax=Gemmatimonas sp. UBA7669 TaxID=1946568 RepID=UPI0025BFE41F|nr:M15 family metallopeptidase [Gemmatimonas sp. UBA7669]